MSSRKRLQYPGEICRPDERIVERIGVKLFRRPYVPPVDLDALEELAILIRPMQPAPAPRPPPEVRPTLVQEIKAREYKNFRRDLNINRVDEPLGLRDLGIVADSMTVIQITPAATFDYKLNKLSNDLTPAVTGQQETDFEIEEVYITNTPQGADTVAVVRVNYNPLLIRIKP